jgi:hypothetical protein
MTDHICAYVKTEPQPENGWHITELHWTLPTPADTEKFVQAVTKRFAEELRRTIQTHQ